MDAALVISVGTLVLLIVDKIFTFWDRARKAGSADGATQTQLAGAVAKIDAVERKTDLIAEQVGAHREEFVEFRTESRKDHQHVKEGLDAMVRAVGGMQVQIRNMVLGSAPAAVELTPRRSAKGGSS